MTSDLPRAAKHTSIETTEFELFYRTHYRAVSQFVLRRLPFDSHDDVVASIFVVAWCKFASAPEPSLAWLYRIASFEIAHERRCLARRPKVVELRDDEMSTDLSTPSTGVVAAALQQLSNADTELLRLLLVEQLGRKEAATVLGCSVETLNVRLHRVRTRLTNALHRISNSSLDDASAEDRSKEK